MAIFPSAVLAESLLVEAEGFDSHGGWSLDQQFMQTMGSPYLLAHGMGKPVADAETTVDFKSTGKYRMWVRTMDWVPGKWKSPGRFQVILDGVTVDKEFGVLAGWQWQDGGMVDIKKKSLQIKLHDLTGFEGRCDAIFFTNDPAVEPVNFDAADPEINRKWRNKLRGLPDTPPDGGRYDVIVVGGAAAGCIPGGMYSRNAGVSGRSDKKPPNVVIIFADDQGYQDLGCFGSPDIKTPNIDGLAADGIRFTSFYSGYCVCSASRASLLTGCYQPRISMPGGLSPNSKVGLHPDEVTIADMLKTRNYATMCVGKWHLGDKPQTMPTAQGFDHYFGLPYSNDMGRFKGWGYNATALDKIWKLKKWDIYRNALYRDTKIVESPINQVTMTERYTEEAVKFIRSNKDDPFFLYFPHNMPHVPLFVSDDRYDPDPHKAYRLAVEHIDWSVGRVLKTLDELGLADNTLVIYSSDNGPWLSRKHHAGSALPLRAGKGTTWEGGMRVPGIMRWPKRIAAGVVSDEVVGTIDMLPTIASITGAKPPKHAIDGLDISALLTDPKAPSPHRKTGLLYYKNYKVEAVRRGKWKLRLAGKKPELYDLDSDIGESTNVASSNPGVVKELRQLAAAYDADLKANSRPIWRGP